MSATIHELPGAKQAGAVAAEVARLKSPDTSSPGQEPHLTLIGRRIQEETKNGDAWIKANLSRERRRALSHAGKFGAYHGDHFWFDEPPLEFDSWEELIESAATQIVERRRETSCPVFDLWNYPTPKIHVWPKVAIRQTTDAERADALTAGTEALASIVAEESAKLRKLRALLRVVRSAAIDTSVLDDRSTVDTWNRILEDVDLYFDSDGNTDLGKRWLIAEEGLAIVSGHAVFASGGNMSEIGEFFPCPRKYVDKQIAEHGAVAT